jgi:hypothetical protein
MGYILLPAVADLSCLIHDGREGDGIRQWDYWENFYDLGFGGEWHFVAMTATADNSQLRAYLDGVFIGNLTWGFTGWNSLLNYANIGAMKASLWPGNQEGAYFLGLIDEVAVFDRPLSPVEIVLYYQAGLDGLDLNALPDMIPVPIDAIPQTCPNELDVGSGWLDVCVLGTLANNVNEIDVASVRLLGVAPARSGYEDVGTPHDPFTNLTS